LNAGIRIDLAEPSGPLSRYSGRVRVRVFSGISPQDPHPNPLAEYRERE